MYLRGLGPVPAVERPLQALPAYAWDTRSRTAVAAIEAANLKYSMGDNTKEGCASAPDSERIAVATQSKPVPRPGYTFPSEMAHQLFFIPTA